MGSRPIANKQSFLQRDLGARTHTHSMYVVQDTAYHDNTYVVVVVVVVRMAGGSRILASLLWHPSRV